MATENINNVEEGIYRVYRNNRRNLPIEIGAIAGYTERAVTEITWNSVDDAFDQLCEESGLGYKVTFDPETAYEELIVFKGIDRSNDKSIDYIGYFGTDAGNILQIIIVTGCSDYKNVAVVAGAGEGADRKVVIVSDAKYEGEARREMYVDARDLQKNFMVATDTGQKDELGNPIYSYEANSYSDSQYEEILRTRGLEKLAENLRTFSLQCEVVGDSLKYGKDFFLGDRVPIKVKEHGINATARVSAVYFVYEFDGKKVNIIFDKFELKEMGVHL